MEELAGSSMMTTGSAMGEQAKTRALAVPAEEAAETTKPPETTMTVRITTTTKTTTTETKTTTTKTKTKTKAKAKTKTAVY